MIYPLTDLKSTNNISQNFHETFKEIWIQKQNPSKKCHLLEWIAQGDLDHPSLMVDMVIQNYTSQNNI